jgi:hypothetical protein
MWIPIAIDNTSVTVDPLGINLTSNCTLLDKELMQFLFYFWLFGCSSLPVFLRAFRTSIYFIVCLDLGT